MNGIIDKAQLIHYFGHFKNHMQNTWCNSIEIGFGRRIGEALADDLMEFAPYLRNIGELMNVHRQVSDTCYISTLVLILADTHTTLVLTSKRYRLIDKEINETCNYFKGHGSQCHVYCETYFPGSIEIPITCVVGGYRFDVVFESCVRNYWKRQ